MSFRELTLLKHYKTYKNNIVKEFYIPVLKSAVLYQPGPRGGGEAHFPGSGWQAFCERGHADGRL